MLPLPRCNLNQHNPTPQGDQKTSTNQPPTPPINQPTTWPITSRRSWPRCQCPWDLRRPGRVRMEVLKSNHTMLRIFFCGDEWENDQSLQVLLWCDGFWIASNEYINVYHRITYGCFVAATPEPFFEDHSCIQKRWNRFGICGRGDLGWW